MEIVVYEKDLLFLVRILEAARKKSHEVRVLKDAKRLHELKDPKIIILNLEFDTPVLLDTLQELTTHRKIRLIGYCSHTNSSLLKEAKEMGIEAMPRSVFVAKINDLF